MKDKFYIFLLKKYGRTDLNISTMTARDKKTLLDFHRKLKNENRIRRASRKGKKVSRDQIYGKKKPFKLKPYQPIADHTNEQVYRPEPIQIDKNKLSMKVNHSRLSRSLKVYPAGHVFEDNNHGRWTGKGFVP